MKKCSLGALKPKVDIRDYKIKSNIIEFPESYTCSNLPPVKNQGQVNSCVAHATAAILETFNKEETGAFIPLSTDFIYGMQGIAFNRLDSGMYLRDACKIVYKYGDVTEKALSGNTEQPRCTKILKDKLSLQMYDDAKYYRIQSYAKCKNENDIKYALMNSGPILASIKWYSKYNIKNNIIYFDETSSFGYHAIMIYGWDKNGWLCQNSWGRKWNKQGRFIYSYDNKISEAWSFIDAKNENVVIPNNNNWFNYIYKILNFIINIFKGER